MIEYMNPSVTALVVLPAAVVAFAAVWRRDVAATSGIAVTSRTHDVTATGLVGATADGYAPKFGPQSRGSSW